MQGDPIQLFIIGKVALPAKPTMITLRCQKEEKILDRIQRASSHALLAQPQSTPTIHWPISGLVSTMIHF